MILANGSVLHGFFRHGAGLRVYALSSLFPKVTSNPSMRKFHRTSILYIIVLTFFSQALVAADDESLVALQQKVAMARIPLHETLRSLDEAVQESKSAPPTSKAENPRSSSEPSIREDAAPAKPGVARALFTTGVRQHEPVNVLTELKRQRKTLFFYTELLGMENRQLQHRWYFDGKEVSV